MVGSRAQPARGGGITTVHIWLIAFVALWLVSTILAVLLYTNREQLVMAAEAAEEESQRYMRRNEASRFNVFLNQAGEKQSLARILDNERIALAHLIGTDETTSAASAATLVNDAIASLAEGAPEGAVLPDLEGADLLTVIDALQAAWKAEARSRLDARKRLAAASRKLKGVTTRQVAAAEKFRDTLADLDERIRKLEVNTKKALAMKNRQVKDLQQRIIKTQDASDEVEVKRRAELRHAQREIGQLRTELQRAQEQLTQFRPRVASVDFAAQADGKIIRAQSGEDLVYINLGRQGHLTLGLRFQVISASAGVAPGGEGKATIEVVGIGPTTAECRVIKSNPADPIMAGDYIVNVVYDRTRKYRFVVEGRFDIDGDGHVDPQDRDRIMAWVKAWGGEVVQLPPTLAKAGAGLGLETVDFVVLGAPPPMPTVDKKRQPRPEERERNRTLRRAYDRFVAIKQEAKDLSVAVLTQSQFLHFIGYGRGKAGPSAAGGRRTATGE